jgi:hypothetical protein
MGANALSYAIAETKPEPQGDHGPPTENKFWSNILTLVAPATKSVI